MKFLKYLWLNIFVISIYADPSVKIEVLGLENNQAYVGQPFQLNVIVANSDRNSGDVSIEGLDKFQVLGQSQSTSMRTVNMVFSAQTNYNFTLNPLDTGDFEIGPARLSQNNKEIISVPEKIKIKVLKRDPSKQINNNQASLNRNNQNQQEVLDCEVFCKLEIDKKSVFVRQPILLQSKVFFRGNVLDLAFCKLPKFSDFVIKDYGQVKKSQENYAGKLYNVVSKDYILYPVTSGQKTIEPIGVIYKAAAKVKRANNFFDESFFDAFFNRSIVEKECFSDNLKINIESIPVNQKEISGVGQFSTFNIFVDKNEIVKSEPLVLKIELAGFANFDQINGLKLNLPDYIKFYESKVDFIPDNSSYSSGKKVFEYVLQVDKIGSVQIGQQEFFYFDTKDKAFKTLKSNIINLNVIKGNVSVDDSSANNINNNLQTTNLGTESNLETEQKEKEQNLRKDINFIEEESNFSKIFSRDIALSFGLFLFLLLFPVIFLFRKKFEPIINFLKSKFLSGYQNKKIVSKYKSELNLIIKKEKFKELHSFFINYLAYKFNLEVKELTEDIIEKKLKELNISEDKVIEFLSYLAQCASFSFYQKKDLDFDNKKLLEKSNYWFFMLESKQN